MIDTNLKDYFYIPEDKLKEENGEFVVTTKDIIPEESE